MDRHPLGQAVGRSRRQVEGGVVESGEVAIGSDDNRLKRTTFATDDALHRSADWRHKKSRLVILVDKQGGAHLDAVAFSDKHPRTDTHAVGRSDGVVGGMVGNSHLQGCRTRHPYIKALTDFYCPISIHKLHFF